MPPSKPSQHCLTARASLEEIRSIKRDFEAAYDLAVSSGKQEEVEKAQELKHDLETKKTTLPGNVVLI